MENINILFTYKSVDDFPQRKLDDSLIQKIAGANSRIKITAIDLSEAERENGAAAERLDGLLSEVEIIVGHRLPKNLIPRAPRLKWIQAMPAGVEMFLADEKLRKSKVRLTNMRGIASLPIAETVLTFMLMFAKKMIICNELKQRRQWQRFLPELLNSKTVGIVGLGNIGTEVSRLSKAFGARVIATNIPARPSKWVDEVFTTDYLSKLLSESDFVVLTVPLTAKTDGIIGQAQFRSMKPSAFLINVSRGRVVDEEALIEALESNRIAGAALDVFAQEPLPAESRLWDQKNIIISPHIAAYIPDYDRRATEIFCDNLRRYISGKRLRNIVNKKLGY